MRFRDLSVIVLRIGLNIVALRAVSKKRDHASKCIKQMRGTFRGDVSPGIPNAEFSIFPVNVSYDQSPLARIQKVNPIPGLFRVGSENQYVPFSYSGEFPSFVIEYHCPGETQSTFEAEKVIVIHGYGE